jgi:hypothetical protein
MMNEPSPAYFEALRATQRLHHNTKKFNGRFLWRYLDVLEPLIHSLNCRTLLDYGCGKAKQWTTPMDDGLLLADRLGVEVTMYDPGLPQYSKLPEGTFDAVVCTQVLGAIPISDLPWVIDRLYAYADKLLFTGERVRPVRKKLHAHMREQMPHEWSPKQWQDVLISEAGDTDLRRTRKAAGLRVVSKIKENNRTTVLDL